MFALKNMRKLASVMTLALSLTLLASCGSTGNASATGATVLKRADWASDVKTAVNDFLGTYGKSQDAYVVFDFDNTSVIFDIEEQLAIYQLETMAFEIKPEQMEGVLLTELSDLDTDRGDLGYFAKGSYKDLVADITVAYDKLYKDYGPFTAGGLNKADAEKIQKDVYWQEFATKMRMMYDLVYDAESASVAYPWILYWFTGMTPDEVVSLSKASCTKYSALKTEKMKWESPDGITSKVGKVSASWTKGVSPAANMAELWSALQNNGIDVWVCSASSVDAVKGAISAFGLLPYCTGLLGMTNKIVDGKYINEYDYTSGTGFTKDKNGNLTVKTSPIKAQTQGIGKVTAIMNAIYPMYNNKGPLAGFMDSTGDFNFCTEFSNLKLVICFNRANRKVTDGGGLIAEIAMYQKDTLGYDLKKANEAGDTLFVLQGRDENGLRSLRPSNLTMMVGSDKEQLFRNEDNQKELDYMIAKKLTVKQAIDGMAVKTSPMKDEIGISKIGFLKEYNGYHSR